MTTHEQVWQAFGPRVVWYPKQTKFFFNAASFKEHWIDPGTEKHLLNHLKLGGFYDGIVQSEDPAIPPAVREKIFKEEVAERRDKFLARVQTGNTVQWVGELGGRTPGLHRFGNKNILLLHGPNIIQGVEGDCSFILQIIASLLPGDQASRFLAWLQRGYLSLKTQTPSPGQALIIAGASGNGKTLTQQQIITPVLGGRSGDAIRFLSGQTGFNGDLGGADHWMVDDQGESIGFNRQVFSDAIKKLVADPWVRIEAKGQDAVTAPIIRRMSIVMNTGSKNMALLPELSEDIKDKLLVFKSTKVQGLRGSMRENNELIQAQLPAFVHYLEGYVPPEEIMEDPLDPRWGTKAYFHPELRKELQATSAAAQVYPLLIEMAYNRADKDGVYEGTCQNIHRLLTQNSGDRFYLEKIVKSIQHFGRVLTEISKQYPDVVAKREMACGTVYKVLPSASELDRPVQNLTTTVA